MDKAGTYRVQIEDTSDRVYLPDVFTICQPEPAGVGVPVTIDHQWLGSTIRLLPATIENPD